jgi:hypothetical protein
MNNPAHLDPDEIVQGRAFCNPTASVNDVKTLEYMISRLHSIIIRNKKSNRTHPQYLHLRDVDKAVHRVVVPDWRVLQQSKNIVAVGFFGQTRPDVDHAPIMDLENELIDQLPGTSGLLTYYNLFRPQYGYGNLVLFQSETAKDGWRDNKRHTLAVELTPKHYFSVRLHNGLIRQGITDDSKFILVRTKYYDFESRPTWRAIREFKT